MIDLKGWMHYNCRRCGAPVKLFRKGSSKADPDMFEFDGVDLSPEDCKRLAAVLHAHGDIGNGIYDKLVKRSKETPQPGQRK